MVRKATVSDKDILDAAKSALARKWTIQQAAESVNMQTGAYRSRINTIKSELSGAVEKLTDEKKEKVKKLLEMLENCFVDGRGRSPRNADNTVSLVDEIFAGLDDDDSVDETETAPPSDEPQEGETQE